MPIIKQSKWEKYKKSTHKNNIIIICDALFQKLDDVIKFYPHALIESIIRDKKINLNSIEKEIVVMLTEEFHTKGKLFLNKYEHEIFEKHPRQNFRTFIRR